VNPAFPDPDQHDTCDLSGHDARHEDGLGMRSGRRALIAGLLGGILLLTAALAFQALWTAAQRRDVARAALRDYATFAAVEFTRRARESLAQNVIVGLLRRATTVNASVAPGRLPPPSLLDVRAGLPPAVDLRDSVRTWFRLVLIDTSLSTARDAPASAVAQWLRDSIPPHAQARMAQYAYSGILGGAPAGEPLVVPYMMRYDAAGKLAVVYGAILAARSLAPVFDSVQSGPPLLPRAVAPIDNQSTLAVEVLAASGPPILGTGPLDAYLTARDTLGVANGGMSVRVAARPDAADRLIIGGLPTLPLIPMLGAVALVAGLLGVAMLQLRRESDLVRMREEFVAGVSHELRTPLAQIRLFTETLLLDRLRTLEERDRALRIVHDESRRLSQMVENLLQFSRTGLAPAGPAAQSVALQPLVQEAVDQFTPLAAQRGVRIDADGPPVMALGNRDALRQVLLNLFDNALRHGPDGQRIAARTVGNGRRVQLVVDDEGPGIPERERERVFERFHTLVADGNRTGTGLGLTVVRELVVQQGGTVLISSSDSGGCRVIVDLPAAAAG
jgi:signal transduction histidine kinase